jgi:hypothetical protein
MPLIVAFILPKRITMSAPKPIGLVTGESLQRPQPSGRNNAGRDQNMNMIRHHCESMQLMSVELAFASVQSSYNQLSDFRTPWK